MTFKECCSECLKNDSLIEEFNRLTNSNLGVRRSAAEIAMDSACGNDPDKEAIPKFVSFVYEYIWMPMTVEEA